MSYVECGVNKMPKNKKLMQTVQIYLDEFLEETVVRRYEIEGVLSNILGDHATRTQMISEIVYDMTETMSDEEIEKLRKQSLKRSRPEQIHTFPKDKDGNLLIPLGGSHGYLMGALKVALLDLFKDKLRDKKWEGYGIGTNINHGIFIKPCLLYTSPSPRD